jgi:DNA-directed RNA polymerase subunit RPC12/RpoP
MKILKTAKYKEHKINFAEDYDADSIKLVDKKDFMKELDAKMAGKIPKSELEPTNPFAVCHTTVDKDKNPDKFERCVHDIKNKNKKEHKKAQFNGEDNYLIDGVGFQDPGGNSALRRSTRKNPRIYPCPTCKKPNRLTSIDVSKGYQCDECANRDEGFGGYGS